MLYFALAEGVGHIKIGFTDGEDAGERLATLQTGSPVPLRLLGTLPGSLEDEKDLHRRFAAHRVTGEWFKPVPELLAIISPKEKLACEGVEVVERTVQIRVLTVGRKQFTKSLLKQLPQGELIVWDAIHDEVRDYLLAGRGDDFVASSGFDPSSYIQGHVWGWVAGGKYQRMPDEWVRWDWMIYEYEGQLHKYQRDFPLNLSSLWIPRAIKDASMTDPYLSAHESIYHRICYLPGWNDQLFIGV